MFVVECRFPHLHAIFPDMISPPKWPLAFARFSFSIHTPNSTPWRPLLLFRETLSARYFSRLLPPASSVPFRSSSFLRAPAPFYCSASLFPISNCSTPFFPHAFKVFFSFPASNSFALRALFLCTHLPLSCAGALARLPVSGNLLDPPHADVCSTFFPRPTLFSPPSPPAYSYLEHDRKPPPISSHPPFPLFFFLSNAKRVLLLFSRFIPSPSAEEIGRDLLHSETRACPAFLGWRLFVAAFSPPGGFFDFSSYRSCLRLKRLAPPAGTHALRQ